VNEDPAHRLARAQRAQAAWDEFIAPQIEGMIGDYATRIVELANKELNPAKRSEMITALSNGIRIAENIRSGLEAAILDGEVAKKDLLRTQKIERMTKPQSRLLNIASGWGA
jgi:hypothetical protein